ncbi:MAG TPA: hypothetical protein VIF61_04595 [Methylocystis sp.]|jgi:hypothetical protein
MRTLLKYTVALSCLVGLASIDVAAAKPRHPHHGAVYAHQGAVYAHSRPPLLVERRSFLDPGTQVPVGSTNRYARAPAYDWGDPLSTYQRDAYMDGILHEAFDPQPQSPLVLPLQGVGF